MSKKALYIKKESKASVLFSDILSNSNGKYICGVDEAEKFIENINKDIRNCVLPINWSLFHLAWSHAGVYLEGMNIAASVCWSSEGRCCDGKMVPILIQALHMNRMLLESSHMSVRDFKHTLRFFSGDIL